MLHTRPPATMGEPVADVCCRPGGHGALDDTVTAWTPLLHGTKRVPLRSAEPPSEKQTLGSMPPGRQRLQDWID